MSTDFQKVDELYHQALSKPLAERASFLELACGGDEEMRREVGALLACQEKAGKFMDSPAMDVAARMLARTKDRKLAGSQLGPYEILSLLGAGGMGEVYLARDRRLERTVAVKVLPAELIDNREQLKRFVQEAKAASSLNHPNIITIYDIGSEGGIDFVVMEYVAGKTLDQLIPRKGMGLNETLKLAIQMADALAKAHSAGIVHRDLKPTNVMMTDGGLVKVLDFGLAKVARPEGAPGSSDLSTLRKTATGVVMGTVQYMSPEQLLGKEVDLRTDIFSLGVVLYEMTTGRLPFAGTSTSETMDRILHGQPEAIARFNYDVPAELERIVRKCLEKDRERRYLSARELLIDLKNLKRDSDSDLKTREKLPFQSRSIFPHFAVPLVTAAIVALLATSVYLFRRRGEPIDSLAVLPFVNASADPNTEYLSDGISESLINRFSQLGKLRVKSRNSVFRYKGREMDAQAAGRELGVRAVLMGRVLQRGDSLSIGVELVDARDNNQIWGEHYNRKLADIVAVQEEISKEISERLRLRLTGEEQKRLTKRYTENSEAYQFYLKGRYHWNSRSAEGLKKGIEYFQYAVEKDPGYAPAYAGLADSYNMLSGYALAPPKESFPRAKEAARRALETDETLAQAHTALAFAAMNYDWNWVEAEREFELAIKLNPNYAFAHHWYALYLQARQRRDEAIAEMTRAVELDPLSLIINTGMSWVFCWAGRYDEAIESSLKALELDQNFVMGHVRLGYAYEQKAMFKEAIAELSKAITLSRNMPKPVAGLGYVYAVSGQRSQALELLYQLKEQSRLRYVSPGEIAMIYAGLSEKDQAFAWLQKAYEERSGEMVELKVDPRFDNLRSDPRFADLLRRVGFTP